MCKLRFYITVIKNICMQIDENHIIVVKITFAISLREKERERKRFVLFRYKVVYNNHNITRILFWQFRQRIHRYGSGILQIPYRFRFMDHLNLVFVVPFSFQAKLITGLESLHIFFSSISRFLHQKHYVAVGATTMRKEGVGWDTTTTWMSRVQTVVPQT